MIGATARLVLAVCILPASVYGESADAPFQVRYADLNVPDSLINITNTGLNGARPLGPGWGPGGRKPVRQCIRFSPDEQMVACCSCHLTPNELVSLSVYNDIRSNSLTGVVPNSLVIKLIASATGPGPSYGGGASACQYSAAGVSMTHPLATGGLAAWGTTAHFPGPYRVPAAPTPFDIAETPFTPATITGSGAAIASYRNGGHLKQ